MRIMIATRYGLTGVLTALWGASLPATDARLDLGAGRLGAVLLAVAAGALVAMPVAGRLTDLWTAPRVLRLATPATALALLGPAVVPSAESLVVAAAVLGMLLGVLNVALSVGAVAVERALGRPVMATMHGTWTLGAVAGGAVTTAGLGAGLNVQVLLAAGAIALALAGFAIGTPPASAPAPAAPRPVTAVRRGRLAMLGLVGAAAFVAEGAATDWAGVHATRVLGADPATGSLSYTAFFVAMTVVRFTGDAVRARLGATATLRLAGAAATVGYGLVLLPGAGVACAIAGWALTGAGMAVVWPIVVSELGAADGSAGRLSVVTMISYGGGLVGPALIGFVAAQATLPVALLIPAALALVVTLVATTALRRNRTATGPGRRGCARSQAMLPQ